MNDAIRRNRRFLVLLAVLFFGPLGLSFLWYYGLDGVRPAPTAQHGELVQPARPLPQASLATPTGRTDEDFLTGYWSMVTFTTDGCGEACQRTVHDLRQLRATLGRERTRVQQVLLYRGEAPDAQWVAQEHPMLVVAALDGPEADELLSRFEAEGRVPAGDTLWLVDPLGNLMMRYGGERTLQGVQDDIKRLLRLSHIG